MNSTIYKSLCAIALSSAMAFSASAEIIHSDLYIAGDHLTTTDTETGLEFLKINQGYSDQYTLGPEWRVASSLEVHSFVDNLLFDVGGFSYTNDNSLSGDFDFFSKSILAGSYTQSSNLSVLYSIGITKDNALTGFVVYGGQMAYTYRNSPHSSSFGYQFWRVREAQDITNVPAPVALSSLALLVFGLTRRKKSMD
jgi:hypothetical protein